MAASRDVQVGSVVAMVIRLELAEQYSYLLEASPRGVRRMVHEDLMRELARMPKGLHIVDLANVNGASEEWLPRELVRARLRSNWVPPGNDKFGHTVLEVMWFQHADQDPLTRLTEICRTLDWATLAVYEPFVD